MTNVALFSARPDFARSLAHITEETYNEYNVDIFSQNQSINWRMMKFLSRNYDIIQVDELIRNGIMGSMLATLCSIPLVSFIRGWDYYLNEHKEYKHIHEKTISIRAEYTLKNTDHTLFISEVCREKICREFPVGSSSVVGRPFEIAKYEPASVDLEIPRPPYQIFTATNLRYQSKARGVNIIIEALEPLFGEYDIEYSIAGDGRATHLVNKYAEDISKKSQINLLGFREDIPNLLSQADLFIYVSFLDALPMAVLEAEASGLPVIAGGTSGVSEAAGTAAIICPPTAEGIRDTVRFLLEEPERLIAKSNASLQRMESYNQNAVDGFVSAWESVL
ncbi:glycosyltransferase family 4 protein [Haladaptatus sp. YSMS36]|uniref:glycosyltransferase family 4 protein n=1 Tax=Haladaptatus sp. YSMS36 TaxID=3033384 RepID=UPI0023E8EA76|nr:glycosyltransferase family 4 protein [Haladaptatus sp. YSMS36]